MCAVFVSASLAIGVGYNFTAIPSGVPPPLPVYPFSLSRALRASYASTDCPSLKPAASGVGHIGRVLASALVGFVVFDVRDDEDALSLVRSSNVGSA